MTDTEREALAKTLYAEIEKRYDNELGEHERSGWNDEPPLIHQTYRNTVDTVIVPLLAERDAASRSKALEEAALICDAEHATYHANARACDASGNTFGGTIDTACSLAAKRCAEAIRGVRTEPKP